MKFLICLLFCVPNAFAENVNISNETNLNRQLLENSALSQEYQRQTGVGAARPTINPQLNNTTTNNNGMNLTDQDKQLSENYVDQAGANKILKENCSGEMEAVCAGRAGKQSKIGVDRTTMEMVTKAYALFSGMGDSKFKMKPKVEKTGETKAQNDESDNCKYIPSVTEALATFSQQQTVNNFNNGPQNAETAQKDALLKAAISHEERSKMAQIQAVGWGGGAACYAYMATAGGAVTDWKLGAKIAAGVLLFGYYQSEVSANQEYADTIRTIASKLPGKGHCNPITEKICYCGTVENKADPEYSKYCSPPGLHNNSIAATSYRVACTDSNMKIDPACNCKNTNSCVDQFLGGQSFSGSLGLGSLTGGAPLGPLRSLARGELVGGNVTTSSGNGAMAIAKQAMAQIASQIPVSRINLNPNQNAFARDLVAKGIPAALAQEMAAQNISPSAMSGAMAKFEGRSNYPAISSLVGARSNLMDFSGGNGLGVTGKNQAARKSDDFLAKLNPSKGSTTSNSKLLEFAAKAQAQGQIRKQDKPLFEIISNRYQESGRRLLEVDAVKTLGN